MLRLALIASALILATPALATPTEVRTIATCNDGTPWRVYADALKGNGHTFACSHHHGVRAWADGSPVRIKRPALNPRTK